MRITLSIPDDLHARLKQYAVDRGITMGQAATYLLSRGFEAVAQELTASPSAV